MPNGISPDFWELEADFPFANCELLHLFRILQATNFAHKEGGLNDIWSTMAQDRLKAYFAAQGITELPASS